MAAGKIVLLVVYAVLAGLALTQGEGATGIWAMRLLGILAVVHLLETAVYFKLCKAAGGSLPAQLAGVFLFGVLHVREMQATLGRK